jgi:DDE superfamily endonuclease
VAGKLGAMDPQRLRDWGRRFNDAGPQGRIDRKPARVGRRLSAEQEAALAALVEAGPEFARDGVVRWRCVDLQRLILTRWNIAYHARPIGKLVAPARVPAHLGAPAPSRAGPGPDRGVQKDFAEPAGAITATLAAKTPVEIWFQEEMRLGQKNPRTRRWARRGTRPRGPTDLRPKSAYLFGAICPKRGAGAAVVMPSANTQAMQHHRDEIARNLAPKAHALVVLDQAGWHTTEKLRLPENLSVPPLPAKSPELNPVENVRQFLRHDKLSNRIFDDYEAIVTAACGAWNSLIADPARIPSIGTRQGATIAHNYGRWVLRGRSTL